MRWRSGTGSRIGRWVWALVTLGALAITLGTVGVVSGEADSSGDLALRAQVSVSGNGSGALCEVEVSNATSKRERLDALRVTLPQGVRYVGVAAGSEVAGEPRRDGDSLIWEGPWALASGDELNLRFWSFATDGYLDHVWTVQALSDDQVVDEDRADVRAAPATDSLAAVAGGVTTLGTSDNLSVSKSANPSTIYPNDPTEYTVIFSNSDGSADTLEVISDTLPANVQFVGMAYGSEVGDWPDIDGRDLVWAGPYSVPGSGSLTLKYLVWVPWMGEPQTLENEVMAVNDDAETVGPESASLDVVLYKVSMPFAARNYHVVPPYLLEHNFDTGDEGWTDFTNYWRLNDSQWYWQSNFGISGGGLRHDLCRGADSCERGAHDGLTMYLADDYQGNDPQDWTDYRYTAKVRLIEGDWAGLWFRGTYIDGQPSGRFVGGYYFGIKYYSGGKVALWRLEKDGSLAGYFSAPVEIGADPYSISQGHWYTLKVEVRGNHIECFVNDTKVFDEYNSDWPHGTIGFMGYLMRDARFDEVLVEPLY